MDYFVENEEKDKRRADAFIRYWNAYKGSHERTGTIDWWRGYLFSEEFQEIRLHPQVVQLLVRELSWGFKRRDFFHVTYMTDEIKSLLWEAYGFREEDGTAYQGDLQKLWRRLRPKRIRRQRKAGTKRLARGTAIILILLFCVWGAYMTNDGKALIPIVAALLYYARTLAEDRQE